MRNTLLTLKNKLFGIFKRKTTSTAFIPEIDGLRFLAIFLVVITHIQSFYLLRNPKEVNLTGLAGRLHYLLNNGNIGVFLFFTISGFILMMPFARRHLLNTEKPSLKKYYLRRLVRLEPPYLLTMIFIFTMKILVQKQDFSQLLPHLGASFLYLHQVIYQEMSRITPIAWSLEIEIQFYLLSPFLAFIFRAPKLLRRIILLIAILILPVIQHSFSISIYNFFGTMQYFLVGFMLLDLYLCRDIMTIRKNIIKPMGVIFLLLLILLKPSLFAITFIYPFLIFIFYYLVLNTEFWNRVFQNKFLTCIGGMCYSIYLLHFSLISFIGMKSFSLKSSGIYLVDISVQSVIQLPIILLICSIFFLLVEKPCMNLYWPLKIVDFIVVIKKRFFGSFMVERAPKA